MTFTESEFDAMLHAVNLNVGRLEQIRKVPLENAVAPPLYFNPLVPGMNIAQPLDDTSLAAPRRRGS